MTELIAFNFIYTKVLALTYSTISKYNVVKNRIIIIGTIKGMTRGMLFKIAKISIRNLLWYLINCSLTSLPCSAVTAVIQNNSHFPKNFTVHIIYKFSPLTIVLCIKKVYLNNHTICTLFAINSHLTLK